MARSTPGTGIPVPESPDPRMITDDLWASFSKVGQLITQTSGESSAALVTAEQAKTAAAQALARALLIEDPIHVGPSEPTEGEELWVDTDDDSSGGTGGGAVSSQDITDATNVGRAILTAPWSADARNALSIFTGSRALLDAGTDTAERTWDAKELHEYVTDTAAAAGGAASRGDLTGKSTSFPPSAHTHDDRYYTEAEVDAKIDSAKPYDSGEIDITAAFNPISGGAYLSRFGPLVTLQLSNLVVSDASATYLQWDVIPTGYRPARDIDFGLTARTTAEYNSMYSGYVRPDGRVMIYKIEAGEAQRGSVTWRTSEAPPTEEV